MTQVVDGDLVAKEYDEPDHGFVLNTDDAGIERLSGQPNLAAGDYRWQLNARDAAGQHVYRAWRFRVTPKDYVSLEEQGVVAGHGSGFSTAPAARSVWTPPSRSPLTTPRPIGLTSFPVPSIRIPHRQ